MRASALTSSNRESVNITQTPKRQCVVGCRLQTCVRKHRLSASTFEHSRGAMKENMYQQCIAMFSTQRCRHIWPVLPSYCSATTGGLLPMMLLTAFAPIVYLPEHFSQYVLAPI